MLVIDGGKEFRAKAVCTPTIVVIINKIMDKTLTVHPSIHPVPVKERFIAQQSRVSLIYLQFSYSINYILRQSLVE